MELGAWWTSRPNGRRADAPGFHLEPQHNRWRLISFARLCRASDGTAGAWRVGFFNLFSSLLRRSLNNDGRQYRGGLGRELEHVLRIGTAVSVPGSDKAVRTLTEMGRNLDCPGRRSFLERRIRQKTSGENEWLVIANEVSLATLNFRASLPTIRTPRPMCSR